LVLGPCGSGENKSCRAEGGSKDTRTEKDHGSTCWLSRPRRLASICAPESVGNTASAYPARLTLT
jgi:hypothetical protein